MAGELSRREQQIMDVLHELGEAGATEVQERLPEPPTRTAVRTLLTILESKGFVEHRADGRRYVYRPLVSQRAAGRSALQRVLRVFFGGSLEQALAAHLSDPRAKLDEQELERLRQLLDEAEGEAGETPRRHSPSSRRRGGDSS